MKCHGVSDGWLERLHRRRNTDPYCIVVIQTIIRD